MKEWVRTVPFESEKKQHERWICNDGETETAYNVEVTLGKPIDILKLKRGTVKQIKESRTAMFKGKTQFNQVCSICNYGVKDAIPVLNVYGTNYYQCRKCSHVFLIETPIKEALDKFYSQDVQYQSTYADKKTLETRVQHVATPKAKYVLSQFERIYGRKPKSILDVGAGSGHFVYACRELGLIADGVEPSESGRQFCKENFDFELINKDFAEFRRVWGANVEHEIITFWGVIEHILKPLEMLDTASMVLSGKDGLVVVEVPRWRSFSTTIQKQFPTTINRHLDPLGHLHCFTDSSLATAFTETGFNPAAAWYFGMDAYELVTQLGAVKKLGVYIPQIQEGLDLARLSDEMVLVGKPT